jgi:hypothetical protein
MSLQQPPTFNIRDLTLDVRLEAIVDTKTRDFTGKKIFSVEFFRKNIGFGITNIDIEVNTSLQPIITINFKDLYGNTVFGKAKNTNPDATEDDTSDFSVLFNWPPPKFIFTFKGFLGKSATWMLNMKKSSISYDSSDGSYDIKCEFVPNQWGFLSDLPFLYLLAVKSLKQKSAQPSELQKIQTIFDLIKIGKQVEVKTQETTKEFDNILKQMTLLKSLRVYDAVFISKVVNYDEVITGQVGNQTIVPTTGSFNSITINSPKGTGNTDIDSPEKIKQLAISSDSLNRINTFLLLTSKIGNLEPVKVNGAILTYSQIAKGDIRNVLPNVDSLKSERIKMIESNILSIENAIKKKTYDSSKDQLEKITIGEIFRQLAEDSGYIMGRILEAGYQGYHKNQSVRDNLKGGLIGKSFPMWITSDDKKEEKPATSEVVGQSVGIETNELQFVNDFIDAIGEGIATELADETGADSAAQNTTGDNFIKKRISNLEALRPNPYKPFYRSIAENIMVRGGIVAYLTRSPDPNKPGDYDSYFGGDRATDAEDVISLADADLENITDSIVSSISEGEARSLKTFSIFWDNLLTEDCKNLKKPSTDSAEKGKLIKGPELNGTYMSTPGNPLPAALLDYEVLIEKPANWDGATTSLSPLTYVKVEGLQVLTLRQLAKELFNKKSGSGDNTNSNFINPDFLQSKKLVNNGLAYFKTPASVTGIKNSYTFVMFDGPNANKTQSVMSAESDAEIKNEAEKQKDETQPLGFINIQNPKKDNGNYLDIINGMNDDRIKQGLLLNYSRLLNPSTSFFQNPNTLVDIDGYFIIPKTVKLGDPDNLQPNELPAKNITISVAYASNNDNELIFGPFVNGEDDSIIHRAYIKRMSSKLKEKINGLEEKKNQIISDVLGKAGEQKDLLYKQMHTLYQQWEVLIIKDSDSANGQDTTGTSPGAITSEMSGRYSKHENFNMSANVNGPLVITNKVASEAADNTFLYGYPLNNNNKANNVQVKNSLINIESLYKPNGNTTILNIIQQICTKNNFIFIPMPGEAGSFSTEDIFTPHVTDGARVKNFFYVQFAPTPETRSTLRNDDSSPMSSSENATNDLPPATLPIRFGSPDNQIVKNITVDTQESKTTAESIINLQRLVDNENQNKKVTTDCSMLPVMEGRSYKATADMLGNAQVFPMQFFYLDSIPLFNGLYQIMKVKHSIKPNDMSTSAEGIRMRQDFQTGKLGGVPPITLETLADLPVRLEITESQNLNPGDFANAVLDQGSGTKDGTTGTDSAGSTAQVNSSKVNKGGSDVVPNTTVTTLAVILPPDLKAVRNSIRLTQSSDANGPTQIQDFKSSNGILYKKEDIIRDMNYFIQDILGPFATYLKANHPKLYKNWYFTSAVRGYVPAGGSSVSQHQTGQAVDSQIVGGKSVQETMQSNLDLFNVMMTWYQQNPIGYDQILWETRKSDKSWIHWSYRRNDNRKQFLRFTDDKTNRSCKLNRTNQYVPPGVTPAQIILTV